MKNNKRKIHIDLTEETHRRLRLKAAIDDMSIQRLVETLITEAVKDVEANLETIKRHQLVEANVQLEVIKPGSALKGVIPDSLNFVKLSGHIIFKKIEQIQSRPSTTYLMAKAYRNKLLSVHQANGSGIVP